MPDDSDRGQVAPLVAVLVLVAAAALLVLAQIGRLLVDRAAAHAAADAAALAGVHGGRNEAEAIARANHGELIDYRTKDKWVEVRVRVGRAIATARAEPEVTTSLPPAPSTPTTQGYAPKRAGS